jgi:prepilin-type N-terminal cleavage/methylation domain-containing protein
MHHHRSGCPASQSDHHHPLRKTLGEGTVKALRARLGSAADNQGGLSLVEVVVAMFIFSIISTGVIYGMISVLALTRDSRAIQVASNLASEEIDLSRAVDDLFTLVDKTTDVVINGDTFHVARTTQWVSDPDVDLVCGAGGGALRYKRVNVTVTWDNMQSASSAVNSYTVIDPKSRINDPALGTILVSVLTASGIGASGVTVTAVPSSDPQGATSVTTAPAPTDSQGCSYILKVVPGNYDVTISRSGYVDDQQQNAATKTVGVGAGAASSAEFTYDKAGTFVVNYVSNLPLAGAKIPTNMGTSFLSTYGTFVSTATNANTTRSVLLHPFSSGYSVLAGGYAEPTATTLGCLAVDPAEWPDVNESGTNYSGIREPAAAALPGGTAVVGVPMGVFTIKGQSSGGLYLKAVSQNGSPACDQTMTYVFGQIITNNSGTTVTVALPFGSWKLYSGTSTSQTTIIGGSRLTNVTKGTVDNGTNTVTLDPRVIVP